MSSPNHPCTPLPRALAPASPIQTLLAWDTLIAPLFNRLALFSRMVGFPFPDPPASLNFPSLFSEPAGDTVVDPFLPLGDPFAILAAFESTSRRSRMFSWYTCRNCKRGWRFGGVALVSGEAGG